MTQQQWGRAPQPQWGQPAQPQWGQPAQPGFSGFPGEANPYAPGPATYSPVPSYGPGPGAQFGPGPVPRRRSPLRALLLALIGVAIVALAALVVTGLVAEPSGVAYQNDDYQVPPPDTNPPPILIPQTEQEVVQWSEANAIYDQTMPAPVRCNAQPIDVQNSSESVLKSHFEGLMECLVRAWQPPVTNAGFHHHPTDGHHLRGEHHHQVRRQRDQRVLLLRQISRSTTAPNYPGPSLAWRGSGPRTW